MGFASPQIKHDENGYTRTSDPDRTLSVFELCEEFKTYFNWQWAQYKDKQASTACGDREIWKWLKRIIELDAEKESENARLRAELSTQETLVATLQEQKYAWDELLSENKRLRAELETAKKCIRSMWKNDKTPTYEYYGKNRRTRFGDCPSVGERWKTPREIAESVIGESALYAIKEQA